VGMGVRVLAGASAATACLDERDQHVYRHRHPWETMDLVLEVVDALQQKIDYEPYYLSRAAKRMTDAWEQETAEHAVAHEIHKKHGFAIDVGTVGAGVEFTAPVCGGVLFTIGTAPTFSVHRQVSYFLNSE